MSCSWCLEYFEYWAKNGWKMVFKKAAIFKESGFCAVRSTLN
jgi:hypothetical protein